jgi:hypothetical protein
MERRRISEVRLRPVVPEGTRTETEPIDVPARSDES